MIKCIHQSHLAFIHNNRQCKNGSTNGTPDSEKTFTQTVSSDSEVLSAINEDEETPFKISLEIKTAAAPIKVRRLYIT